MNKPENKIIDTIALFSETESNHLLNSQNFIYITSTDPKDLDYDILGFFYVTKMQDIIPMRYTRAGKQKMFFALK